MLEVALPDGTIPSVPGSVSGHAADAASAVEIKFYDPRNMEIKSAKVIKIDVANQTITLRHPNRSQETIPYNDPKTFRILEEKITPPKKPQQISKNFNTMDEFLDELEKIDYSLVVSPHEWQTLQVKFKKVLPGGGLSKEITISEFVFSTEDKILVRELDGSANWYKYKDIQVTDITMGPRLTRMEFKTEFTSSNIRFRLNFQNNTLFAGEKYLLDGKEFTIVGQHGDIVAVEQGDDMFYLSNRQIEVTGDLKKNKVSEVVHPIGSTNSESASWFKNLKGKQEQVWSDVKKSILDKSTYAKIDQKQTEDILFEAHKTGGRAVTGRPDAAKIEALRVAKAKLKKLNYSDQDVDQIISKLAHKDVRILGKTYSDSYLTAWAGLGKGENLSDEILGKLSDEEIVELHLEFRSNSQITQKLSDVSVEQLRVSIIETNGNATPEMMSRLSSNQADEIFLYMCENNPYIQDEFIQYVSPDAFKRLATQRHGAVPDFVLERISDFDKIELFNQLVQGNLDIPSNLLSSVGYGVVKNAAYNYYGRVTDQVLWTLADYDRVDLFNYLVQGSHGIPENLAGMMSYDALKGAAMNLAQSNHYIPPEISTRLSYYDNQEIYNIQHGISDSSTGY